jgi:hypothetical protein
MSKKPSPISTQLGNPLLMGEDAIRGHSFWKGATIFPTQLAMAASWNTDLLEQVGRVTAEEVVPTGIHWTFSPVFCLTRDTACGRRSTASANYHGSIAYRWRVEPGPRLEPFLAIKTVGLAAKARFFLKAVHRHPLADGPVALEAEVFRMRLRFNALCLCYRLRRLRRCSLKWRHAKFSIEVNLAGR